MDFDRHSQGWRAVRNGRSPRSHPRRCRVLAGLVLATAALALISTANVEAVTPGINGKLAIASDDGGDREIFTKDALGTVLQLTSNGFTDEDPSWSPDSTAQARIVFTTDRDLNNEIYTMNADGSAPANISNDSASDRQPAWSPDGTKIAFASTRDGDAEIYLMNPDGTGVVQLTSNAAPYSDAQPAWSPDGTKIAFASDRDGDYEIYTMRSDGTGVVQLTSNSGANAADLEPSWSPDGTRIAFTTNRDGNYEVYKMTSDGASPAPVLTIPGSTQQHPTWAPDGTKVVISTNHLGDYEIFSANPDGSSPTNLTVTAASNEYYPDVQPEQEPDTTIVSGPSGLTNSTSAIFEFTASESGTTFQCRLDAGAWSACSSPATIAVADGDHTAELRATDLAGNTDATPASRSWSVDATPPNVTIDSAPAGQTSSSTATIAFHASESGTSFECRLDAGAWSSCSSPMTTTVADGDHTAEVRATDPAGNTDATPASRNWSVDATSPDVTIDSGPAAHTRSTTASFSFHASEGQVAYECSVDGGAFAACTSPETVGALAPGDHSFAARASDQVGNIDPSPATHSWTVDRRAPDVTVSVGRATGRGKVRNVRRAELARFRGTASDSAGVYKVKVALRISGRVWSADTRCRFLSLRTGRRILHQCKRNYTRVAGTTSWSFDIPKGVRARLRDNEEYVLYVRATDLAGNNEYTRTRFMIID